jgi:hypothetical protein
MTIHDERRLTELLHRVDVPASRADIERAMADGAARRRRRAIVSGGAGIGALVAVAALTVTVVQVVAPDSAGPDGTNGPTDTATGSADVTTGPPEAACAVEPLRLPPGAQRVLLSAVDPSGRYVVGHAGGDAVIRWTDGTPSIVGGPDIVVRDVNRAGTMVGWRGRDKIVLYRDGVWHDLGVSGEPWAINDRGDIVGADPQGRLVVWPAGRVNQPRVLAGATTDIKVSFYDIADDGSVAAPASDNRPHVWAPDGTVRDLPLPAGVTRATVTRLNGDWAIGVGNRGAVQGNDGKPISVDVSLRWRLDTGTVEALPIGGSDMIVDVTPQGVAVFNGVNRPVTLIAPDGTQVHLPKPGDEPRTLVAGISDDGRTVAGDAYGIGAESIPYVWHC